LEYVGWVEKVFELNYGVLNTIGSKQITMGVMQQSNEMNMVLHLYFSFFTPILD
jgi:hypothetical protein